MTDLSREEALCESCGVRANVRLADGSTWCAACDAAARRMGYDDAPGVWVAAGPVLGRLVLCEAHRKWHSLTDPRRTRND